MVYKDIGDFEFEHFEVFDATFNIKKAKFFINKIKPKPIRQNIKSLKHFLNTAEIHTDYAIKHAKPEIPLILGLVCKNNINQSILLDGHHRLYKAIKENKKTIYVFMLDQKVTNLFVNQIL